MNDIVKIKTTIHKILSNDSILRNRQKGSKFRSVLFQNGNPNNNCDNITESQKESLVVDLVKFCKDINIKI